MKYAICFLLLSLCGSLARAQQGVREDDPPVQITLYPQSAPVPALKYALLPRYIDQIEGNAAVYYGKVTAEQIPFFSSKEMWEDIDRWQNEVPLEELKQVDFFVSSIVYQLDMAARCEYCDWQLPVRREQFYTILLPEVQQTRQFARILAAKARIHIAKGEYDEALADMRRGYALGRHVAEGETLINGLVGIAIGSIISEQVHTLVQQPDAPNLYWALTELPDPMISLRKGVMVEMNSLEMSFPELQNVERDGYTAEYWRNVLDKFGKELSVLIGNDEPAFSGPILIASALRGYPLAKQALIEQGLPAGRVEAMPVAQVILIYSMRTYRELNDDVFKWFFVPYPEGNEGMDAAEEMLRTAHMQQREIIPLASMLLPAIRAVRTAEARMSQRIALLRVLEALRMHAAANEGQLPASLDEIKIVPIPVDPVTGQPFSYSLQDGVAQLQGEPVVGWHAKYEIRLGVK